MPSTSTSIVLVLAETLFRQEIHKRVLIRRLDSFESAHNDIYKGEWPLHLSGLNDHAQNATPPQNEHHFQKGHSYNIKQCKFCDEIVNTRCVHNLHINNVFWRYKRIHNICSITLRCEFYLTCSGFMPINESDFLRSSYLNHLTRLLSPTTTALGKVGHSEAQSL